LALRDLRRPERGARQHRPLSHVLHPGLIATTRAWSALGRALDPERYFIVIPNLFGNGVSSSPSHAGAQRGRTFPNVTVHDNVVCHERLLREHLGIDRIALAFGWSMGAQQAYHFAALFPDRVPRPARRLRFGANVAP